MDRIEYLRDKAKNLTDKPGVYLMKDKTKKIIYVGKAKKLKNRVGSYFRQNASHDEKTQKMVSAVDDFDFIVTDSEYEALVLECSLIKQHNPKYNILLKDSRGYSYVFISDGEYPKITAEKKKIEEAKNGEWLGPYMSSMAVIDSVDQANRIFKLPVCKKDFPGEIKKGRPCLNYHIKRCAGVCTGSISKEAYGESVKLAVKFLKNGSFDTVESMTKEMSEAAERLEFEKAALLRDRISAIIKITEKQKIQLKHDQNLDVVSMSQNNNKVCFAVLKFRGGRLTDKQHHIIDEIFDIGEARMEFLTNFYSSYGDVPKTVLLDESVPDMELLKMFLSGIANANVNVNVPQKGEGYKLIMMAMNNATEQLSYKVSRTGREIQALDELSRLLGLESPPEYIEAYDISNMGDSGIVGGMAVFENGRPLKSAYKRFNINDTATRDDYLSMKEVIRRRFRNYMEKGENDNQGFAKIPDLILIDGGKGHISAVSEVLDEYNLDIPMFGMVKDDRHRTRAIAAKGGEISINSQKSAFALVTKIQDEVHRYTISFQRTAHKKLSYSMELTKIKGIGEKKALKLINQFKTKKSLKEASAEEIMSTISVSAETAAELKKLINEMR